MAVGIAIHHATRSKKIIDLLHAIGFSVDYNRIIRIETQLANSVLQKMEQDGGYIPPMMEKGMFVCFAIDNTDFNEDTIDGKRTLHGTVTAIYQTQSEQGQLNQRARITGRGRKRTIANCESVNLMPCHMDKKKPTYEDFIPGQNADEITKHQLKDNTWLVTRSVFKSPSRAF